MVASFSKKRKEDFFSKKLFLQLAGISLVAIVIVLIWSDINIYQKRKGLESQIELYQNQIESLKKANKDLEDKIVNSDNIDYLEKIAYEELGEQKPGEKGVIFIAPKEQLEKSEEPKRFWTGWISNTWNWIKSKF